MVNYETFDTEAQRKALHFRLSKYEAEHFDTVTNLEIAEQLGKTEDETLILRLKKAELELAIAYTQQKVKELQDAPTS